MRDRLEPTAGDLVPVAVLAAVAMWEVPRRAAEGGDTWWLAAVTALCVVPLVCRRSFALPVLGIVAAAFAAYPLRDGPEVLVHALCLLVALYAVAAHSALRPAVLGLAVGVLAGLARSAALEGYDAVDTVVNAAWALPAWLVGRLVRHRERRAVLAEGQAREAERRAAVAEHQAAEAERRRIARELHDVVAHAVTVMVVQARAGRHCLGSDPDAALGALLAVEKLGQEALTELRRLLAVLPADERVPDPLPGLADAERLVERVRAAGLDVELRREGEGPALSPAADFSAYRVLQEALTNALRYGGPGRTVARLVHYGTGVDIDVVSPLGASTSPVGGGAGLVGARERVAAFGGTLQAGCRGDSFVLRVTLPAGAGA